MVVVHENKEFNLRPTYYNKMVKPKQAQAFIKGKLKSLILGFLFSI